MYSLSFLLLLIVYQNSIKEASDKVVFCANELPQCQRINCAVFAGISPINCLLGLLAIGSCMS